MKASLETKLTHLSARSEQLAKQLSDPLVIADQTQFQALSKEYAHIEPVVTIFKAHQKAQQDHNDGQALLAEEQDAAMQAMIQEELKALSAQLVALEEDLQVALLPKDPDDERPAIIEIRAGTGGDEAALFAGDLYRMYTRYADTQRWSNQVLSAHEGEQGGYKEIIVQIKANGAYGRLKFESGAHRVQRVPDTESSGRIHTSACTVAVMPVIEDLEDITIDPSDLKVDTFRASGAGGQHVNTTDSAIRITHIPSGVVVECQDERSQHQNRAKAMMLLHSRIMQAQKDARLKAQADTRRQLVGSGDRSERIRTYNFPQKRVTDHRIALTLYKLSELLEGDLDVLIVPLSQEHQADLMAALNDAN